MIRLSAIRSIALLPVVSAIVWVGCQAETGEVRKAVDNVKNSVDDVQTKMDAHNKQLEEMLNQGK